MNSNDRILELVRKALDEFDDRRLEVSVRRAVRIASLIGDSRSAVRLGHELKGRGGDSKANAADTRRLMADPSSWGSFDGPAEQALSEYMKDREMVTEGKVAPGEERIFVHSIAEIEDLVAEQREIRHERDGVTKEQVFLEITCKQVLERTRHRTFSLLCSWERQFGYSAINESIFSGYQKDVDRLITAGIPALVEQFTAVYRRLRDAADSDPEKPATEELSQALTSCRRILKAVADHVFPATSEMTEDGRKLDDPSYRNRLFEYIKRTVESESERALVKSMVGGLDDRFAAIDKMTNKAVHAEVAQEIARLCAINTYVTCGEVLRLHELQEAVATTSP